MGSIDFITIGPLQEIHFAGLTIPTYYLVISIACCLGIYWSFLRAEEKGLSQDIALNLNIVILISGFLGARLFHIIYEAPSYYIQNPIEVFYFWQGGFVFLGGALAGYAAAVFYIRKKGEPLWLWHDMAAPVVAMTYAVGRLACFLQGCCYGKVCDLPWAFPLRQMNIHTELVSSVHRHPTALYIVFWELGLLTFLIYKEKELKKPGHLFFYALLFHSLGRVGMEVFRADDRGPAFGDLSISLTLSLVFVAISLIQLHKYQSDTK